MKITDASLKRKVAVVVLSIAALALGIFSLSRMDVDYLPEVEYPMVKIHIWWPGATPEEIETNIAEPLERSMATVDNLDYLDASCMEGMYNLLVNFTYGVDVDVAYQDVLAIMGRVTRNLPDDIDPPVIIKADPSQLPIVQLTLSSDQRSMVWLRDWADNWLVDRLNSVPGTAGAEIVGGLKREIRVLLDPMRLAAYGITVDQVASAIRVGNKQTFAGRVTVKNREIIARTMGEFENLDEIRNTVVKSDADGTHVYVKDLATVEDSHEEMRVATRFNRKPAIKLNVLKQAQANTITVAEGVKEKIAELRSDIPDDIEFGVVENQGDYVMNAINSVRNSALLSAILVILVVYLFLGHWRQVAVMVIALPLTLLANFFIMYIAGFSLNLFSLGGLVVSLGVILDNSIVVLENISRMKHEREITDHNMGDSVVVKATEQVGPAIIASTLTFLGIFLPFLIVPGMAALLFKELVLVVASIVLISLLVAITFTPVLTKLLVMHAKKPKSRGIAAKFDFLVDRMQSGYASILNRTLHHRKKIIVVFVILFFGGLWLAGQVGSEFLPRLDDGRVMVKLKMPAGTSVEENSRILANVEGLLEGIPEIESMFTLAGGRVWGLATLLIPQEGQVDIQLVPKSERDISTAEFIKKIKPIVKKAMVAGAKMPVMQQKIKGIRKIGQQQVEIKVQGDEIGNIFDYAKQVMNNLNNIPEFSNLNLSMNMTKPEYRIYIDRAKASALGISVNKIATTLRGYIGGIVSTEYRDGSEYYDINVLISESDINNKEDLENLLLETRKGNPIYVRDVARVERAVGPVEITRENQIKQVIVRADAVEGVSVGEAINIAKNAVSEMPRPTGVSFEMGGQAQMMRENRQSMTLIMSFALLFAYVVLAIQFNSFKMPFLIIVGIPLSVTGAFIALFLTGTPIGLTALIGMVIMMGGIAAQGVVLLSMAEDYRAEGLSPLESIRQAAPIRLRPILMTQLTTILGLFPLALNLGEGGDMLMPMAVAVIGGLLYSLLLTLFFLPSAYSMLFAKRKVR